MVSTNMPVESDVCVGTLDCIPEVNITINVWHT